MKTFAPKIGLIAAGIAIGIACTMLIGAAQVEKPDQDRYDVTMNLSIAGAFLIAHDRQEQQLLVYTLESDTSKAELSGKVDLKRLGEKTLDFTELEIDEKQDEKPAEDAE